jgi:hypothetical protein
MWCSDILIFDSHAAALCFASWKLFGLHPPQTGFSAHRLSDHHAAVSAFF